MEVMVTKVITKMPQASVTEDGELIELVFKDQEGVEEALQFSSDDFERFITRAVQLFTHARNQKLSIGDHLAIHPVPAVTTMANTQMGGGRVILSIRADNGIPYHFSISPEEAEALPRQLFRAAKDAKKQASKSRH